MGDAQSRRRDADAVPELVKLYTVAANALKPTGAQAGMAKASPEENAKLCSGIIAALGEIGRQNPAAIGALRSIESLESRPELDAQVVQALGKTQSPEAVARLEQFVTKGQPLDQPALDALISLIPVAPAEASLALDRISRSPRLPPAITAAALDAMEGIVK